MSEKNLQRVLLCCFLVLSALTVYLRTKPGAPVHISGQNTTLLQEAALSESTDTNALAPRTADLNAATAQDLMCVPGIGEKLANAVISHRAKLGGFTYRGQLCGAEGIGEALAARIMTYFYIPGEHPPDTTAAAETPCETVCTETTLTEPAVIERDLNLASAQDLMCVSGIGEKLADAIIAHRAAIGGFTYRGQLCEINGIGEVLAARIMAEFYITDEQDAPQPEPAVTRPEPEPEPLPEPETEPPVQPAQPEPLDLNQATLEMLLELPGMTERAASALLALRDEIGAFTSIYETFYADAVTAEIFENVILVWLYVPDDPAFCDAPAA